MVGATEAHNIIAMNIHAILRAHLKGSNCTAFIGDMKVRVDAMDAFYYPDVMVTCEPYNAKSSFKSAPVLLVEVLSPSTSDIDRREKMAAYKKLTSAQEYVIIYQDEQLIERYQKSSQGEWILQKITAPESLQIKSLPGGTLTLSLEQIYEGVF
jgi:Uma2 family endonuclease